MVDIHSHILYGIDDGSKDIENSVLIAKEAVNAGFTQICCTPHYLEPDFISSINENKKRLECLETKLKDENIKLELRLGNEIYLTENTIEDVVNKKALTLGESKYILIELPMMNELRCSNQIINELLQNGYKVIVAHPERYRYIQKDSNYLIPYIKKGILFQSNFGSIIGWYGEETKKCVIELLKRNMIQVLATDNHRTETIYYQMKKICPKIKEKFGNDYFEELTEINPSKILNNYNINIREIKNKNKFIFF